MNHLEAKGKIDYDFKEDALFFYKVTPEKDHEYVKSYDIDGLIIDLDSHDHVIGIELLNASRKLMVDKKLLKFAKSGKLNAEVNKKIIKLGFFFAFVQRNKERIATLNLERLNKEALKEIISMGIVQKDGKQG